VRLQRARAASPRPDASTSHGLTITCQNAVTLKSEPRSTDNFGTANIPTWPVLCEVPVECLQRARGLVDETSTAACPVRLDFLNAGATYR
jgi:hypothetical protein